MGMINVRYARPERLKDVPESRLRGDDVLLLSTLSAVAQKLKDLADNESFRNRVRTVPGGLRDLMMLRTKAQRLSDDLQYTIPEEKFDGVVRATSRMRMDIHQGPIASRETYKDTQIITGDELVALCDAAHEYKCKVCIDGRCATCELGKAFDNLMAYDRNGGSWSTIDIGGLA